jgi:RimJ/RimL family protein N-acetyltransferase
VTLPITTGRFVLRRFTYNDIPDLLDLLSQPSVARTTPEIEGTQTGLRRYIGLQNSYQPFQQKTYFDLAIERLEDGKVIGLLTLGCQEHQQAEIGWALGVEYRGQGYVTEAARALITYGFTTLGLHRIHARTSSQNAPSWGLMERLGMRKEAHLREAEFCDGQWLDIFIFATLAAEWKASDSD